MHELTVVRSRYAKTQSVRRKWRALAVLVIVLRSWKHRDVETIEALTAAMKTNTSLVRLDIQLQTWSDDAEVSITYFEMPEGNYTETYVGAPC